MTGRAVPHERDWLHSLARHLWIDSAAVCWPWRGYVGAKGYGVIGGGTLAHRVVYELTHGPIPHGLTIDHLCRNRRCVNPAHLEAVTMQENYWHGRRAREEGIA